MDAAPKPRSSGRLSRLFVAALIVLAALAVIRSLAPQTVGETARREFQRLLNEHYADLSFSIRRGRFEPGLGLVFEDIRITEPASGTFQFQSKELCRVARLTVVADLDLDPERLRRKQAPMKTRRLILQGVRANVWLDADGGVSLAKLYPLPSMGPVCPRVEVRDARLRLLGDTARSRPVEFDVKHVLLDNRSVTGGQPDMTIRLAGRSDFANAISMQCDLLGDGIDLRAAAKDAHLSRDVWARLPRVWRTKLVDVDALDCVCDLSLSLFHKPSGPLDFLVRASVHEGRFDHAALPKPITDLRGVVSATPHGLKIEASQARLGDAVIRASGTIDGYQWPAPTSLSLSARGLLLDPQLAASLPDSMQTAWDRLRPFGKIDFDAQVRRGNSDWKTSATVICKGVDLRYEKFPYPVEQLVGRVEIRDNIATSESLQGRISGQRLQCAFRIPVKPGVTNEKSFVLATEGPVPIDSVLIRALSPRGSPESKLETFVKSLRPRGAVHLKSATFAMDANGRPSRILDLRIVDGHLRYEKFAYPLYNVEGSVQVQDNLVKLIGFRGTNANAGLIRCDGIYRMAAQSSPEMNGHRSSEAGFGTATPAGEKQNRASPSFLSLGFRANNIPADEALRSSLPESARHTWDVLSPSGVLDEIEVTLEREGESPTLGMDITARQKPTEQVTSRSLSIRPTSLPYRLDITGGTVRYDGTQVIIDSIDTRHDASAISANGSCVRRPDGRWELLLNLHSGSRVNPDAELIAALPSQMREAMRRLQLRGPINMRGKTRFLMSDDRHPEPVIDWNLILQLEGNRIGDVGPVHALRGELWVEGRRDAATFRADGEVRIDSMHVNDLQLTGIRGPFAIRGDRLLLGGGLPARTGRPTVADLAADDTDRSIRGRMFGGTIEIDGLAILSRASFDVDLSIREAQVPTLLADFGHNDADLTGTFSGKTQLQGTLGTTELLKGVGAARVSGANLYQLPLIVQVLNQLRITPTEDVAFTDGELEFSIFGDTVTFSEMQIWGDLVALDGGGTLDRRGELDLSFNTRVSPQSTFTKILRPLRSERYTLWTIDVRGPLRSPVIERRALEAVGETLETLFPGMAGDQPPAAATRPKLGRWFR